MSGTYDQITYTPRGGGRQRRGQRGRSTPSATPAAPSQVDAEYAINQDVEYLASSAFDNFDINQIIDGVPLPWDPEDMDNYHRQSHHRSEVETHGPPIRSASKFRFPLFLYSFAISFSTLSILSSSPFSSPLIP
jgi:hypothetical protein